MKKFFKYLGIAIAVLLLIVIIIWNVVSFIYADLDKFVTAMEKNDIITMNNILDKGFDINQSFLYFKTTPLAMALVQPQIKFNTVKFMIENGADVNKPNWHNFSPLSLAMLRKHSDIVALLLENGADTSYIVKGYTYAELAQQIGNQEIIKLIKQYQQ